MKKGFTLIELLIIIAILAILSAIVLGSFGTSRSQARDARRVSDIGQLQIGLESYFQQANSEGKHFYPEALTGLTSEYISTRPKDPSTNAEYQYLVKTDADTEKDKKSYCLGANLENEDSITISQNNSCTGVAWCTLTTNYKVCR